MTLVSPWPQGTGSPSSGKAAILNAFACADRSAASRAAQPQLQPGIGSALRIMPDESCSPSCNRDIGDIASVGMPIAGIAKLSGSGVTDGGNNDIGGMAIAGIMAPGACIIKVSGCTVGANCCGHGGKKSTPLDCVRANCCGTGGH